MYDLINSCNNLTDLRYTEFPQAIAKTNLVPERLSPTYKAAEYHSARVYLQIMQWANFDNTIMEPTDWGWFLTNDHTLAPRMHKIRLLHLIF